ncbi:MAG TPA: permease prefix domain 1-containing protein, partial [Gemmataceae bacterium]|nr:permease prefix domain 1-containing protein [Gemmataceae bacterium]
MMRWYRRLFRRTRTEKRLDAELRFHQEQQIADYLAGGMTPEEARRRARLEFGGLDQVKEECRDLGAARFIETLIQDVRYALRQVRRNPGFTAVAVVTLALGIGANTAIFSVVDGVLIHPLPFEHSDRLVMLWQRVPHFGSNAFTTPDFLAWKKQTFMPIAATSEESFNIGEGNPSEHVPGGPVSASFFSLLDVKPVIGRTFLREEDRPNSRRIVILSYRLWKRDFGADRAILGKAVHLNGQFFTVIGVMPRNFRRGLQLAAQL